MDIKALDTIMLPAQKQFFTPFSFVNSWTMHPPAGQIWPAGQILQVKWAQVPLRAENHDEAKPEIVMQPSCLQMAWTGT